MNSWAFLLAAGLLTTPPDVAEPPIDTDEWPAVQEALQTLAVEWEILDTREIRYVLGRQEDYNTDLNLLRRRYQELKDAPRLADCQRWPARSTANDLLTFNREYRRHLEGRQCVDHERCFELRRAIKETDALYRIWDSVRDARCEYYYITVRRLALLRLRCELGTEDYMNGDLPPHVPLWRFQPVY